MSRSALVYNHERFAGRLDELEDGRYRFTYDAEYLVDATTEPVSLTLPKRREPYVSETLFAFFYGLAAEGSTRQLQANLLRVDPDDTFALLMATGGDTIGSVTIAADE